MSEPAGRSLVIRSITAEAARTVRHPVLREGLPVSSAILDRDDDPATLHVGAFDGSRLFAVATFFSEPCQLRPGDSAWRLRGMATLPDMRGRGAGRALIEEGRCAALEDGAAILWCNARLSARGFYEKLGFAARGREFDLPRTGPHTVMIKELR